MLVVYGLLLVSLDFELEAASKRITPITIKKIPKYAQYVTPQYGIVYIAKNTPKAMRKMPKPQ